MLVVERVGWFLKKGVNTLQSIWSRDFSKSLNSQELGSSKPRHKDYIEHKLFVSLKLPNK